MDVKECLQELNENFDLPAEEYKNLAGFKELEQQPDIVDRLLAYPCPELVKLVCLSDKLPSEEFPYMKKLYSDIADEEIGALLQELKNPMALKIFIVDWADMSILRKIKGYFLGLDNEYNFLRHKKSKVIAEHKRIVQKHASEREIEDIKNGRIEKPEELIKKQQELNDVNQSLNMVDCNIQWMKPYREYIDNVMAEYGDSAVRQARYKSTCVAIDKKEIETFLSEFIGTGSVSEKYKNLDDETIGYMLQILASNAYEGYRILILIKLYEKGSLKLSNKSINTFLLKHGRNVNDYLVKLITSGEEANSEIIELLVDILLQIELENTHKNHTGRDIDAWAYIKDEKIWQSIFQRLSEVTENTDVIKIIAGILARLEDNAKLFVKELLDYEAVDRKFSGFQVARELLSLGIASHRAVLMTLLDGLAQKHLMLRRDINRLERGERARSQELFSAIYQPIENLEDLAINLRINKDFIPWDKVGTHLAEILVSLREGLENVGLYSLAKPEDWQSQNSIPFSKKCHVRPMSKDIERVRLSTMGFRYQNEDGKEVRQLARVYTPKGIKVSMSRKVNSDDQNFNKQMITQKHNLHSGKINEVNRDDL